MTTSSALELMVQTYEAEVWRGQEYLESRGLSIADASLYRLGVVADDRPESAQYVGRLAIPYITPAGVRDIRFRCINMACVTAEDCVGHPKYMSRPGEKGLMYNVGALWRDSETIAICEGEMDGVIMDLFSGAPAVGVPGANAWKSHFPKLFSDYQRVLVIGDGDRAGREFAKVVAASVENAMPVSMLEGMDVNKLYLAEGPGAIEALVAA